MDPEGIVTALAGHGVAYSLDHHGEPVYGPALSSEGARVIPELGKENIKALAGALNRLEARLDPTRAPGSQSDILAKPLGQMLSSTWYLPFYTNHGKLELLHEYTHRTAEIVAPWLNAGERVIAAVQVERAGKEKNVDLYMKAGALAGNLMRRKRAQSTARELDFPDASAMVLVVTDQRIAAFQQDVRSRFGTDGLGRPGDHIGDVALERVGQVEGGKPETVRGSIQRAGYLRFIFRDGNSHVLSAWGGGVALFAAAINAMAARR